MAGTRNDRKPFDGLGATRRDLLSGLGALGASFALGLSGTAAAAPESKSTATSAW